MNSNLKIELLFPTPVLRNRVERKFTHDELELVKQISLHTYKNDGNNISNNDQILEHPTFVGLKEIITSHLELYIQSVYKPKHNLTPYITKSWLNYTKPGGFQQEHYHAGSFLSGVLYINAVKDNDEIAFRDDTKEWIAIEPKTVDNLNAKTWWFGVETGDIIIFPSNLMHRVDVTKSNETRISLAFNSFLKGRT
jgi:uncharacterized protein (TIGR02466 family)